MERMPVDPAEMELRHDMDYTAILEMIDEGGPIFSDFEGDEPQVKMRNTPKGYDENELPYDYQ